MQRKNKHDANMADVAIKGIVIALSYCFGVSHVNAQPILYVDSDAQGAGDGSSWCSAMNLLQDALAAASAMDSITEIRVAKGIYKADEGGGRLPGDQAATFSIPAGTRLIGGFAGCGSPAPNLYDPAKFTTILSGDLLENDPVSSCCFKHERVGCDESVCEAAVCESVGNTACCDIPELGWDANCAQVAATNCGALCAPQKLWDNTTFILTIDDTDELTLVQGFVLTHAFGSAISSRDSVVEVRDCIITRNSGPEGAAARIVGGVAGFFNVRFLSNTPSPYVNFGGQGGAIFSDGAHLTFDDCRFRFNSTADLNGRGGAIACLGGSMSASRCEFVMNATLSLQGGALYIADAALSLSSCVFNNNISRTHGGAVFLWNTTAEIAHCTFVRNLGRPDGAGIKATAGSAIAINSVVFWRNVPWLGVEEVVESDQISANDLEINYSCVHGWTGELEGVGNFTADPAFIDETGPDGFAGTIDDGLRLRTGSSLIDAGDPSLLLSVGDAEFDGHARVLCGRADIGAFEWGIEDFDCNGDVDLDDFAAWPDCAIGLGVSYVDGECAAFDLPFDGAISLRDYAVYQRLFGAQVP